MGFMGEALNQWVQAKLRVAGWSDSELARRAEISQSHISRVLSGVTKPGAKFYMGMSKAFGLPISTIELLDKKGIIPQDEDENSEDLEMSFTEWREVMRQLSRAQRVELLKYAFRLLLGQDDIEDGDASASTEQATSPTQ